MDKMSRIHELIDELAEEVKRVFPEATKASVTFENDGYACFSAERWEPHDDVPIGKIAAVPRRTVFDHHRQSRSKKWSEDRSKDQNEYYEMIGILLKEENENERVAG